MRKTKRSATRWLAILLLVAHLFSLTACGNKQVEPAEINAPTENAAPAENEMPTETEGHSHEFVDGLCQCGESNGLEGIQIVVDSGLNALERQDSETGMTLISSNGAGDPAGIRLDKDIETAYGHFYEMVYRFTSNVAGSVHFACEGATMYEEDTFDVVAGENEIVVRFAAGENAGGKVAAGLELGGLDKFELHFSDISFGELTEDMSDYFLDVAPEKASGTMEKTPEGFLKATYKTEEGWRVKLAVDRALVKGKSYETTFVFLREGGKDQNVTYTVYDGAATIIGSKTKWVDSDLCVATFYLTANETVAKGTCLELGMLSGGEEATVTFTYVDFKEVDQEKLEKLLAENPFPGVNVWTEGALIPAVGTQSADVLTLVNTNPATDWWKVKLEQELQCQKGKYYRVTFHFTSNAAGRIKFVNDDATYYGSNEYDVKKGNNTFTVELKSGGNSYSCLELGGLGPCELQFTDVSVKEIYEPSNTSYTPGNGGTTANRFSSFNVWRDSSVKTVARKDTATTMTLTSQNEPTDWWKIKVEKDIKGTTGKCYEVTYTFTSDAAGRIKFVNDEAVYYGSNEYDVVKGENSFTVQFKYNGKPYSCLELGGLGPFKLVFTNYSIKEIEEPEQINNGFESYQAWTESSMKPLTREDTKDAMILISENEPGDWWKVKLENNFALEAGKTYKAVYTFTSDAEGDIKFGTNEKVVSHTADVYHAVVGENKYEVIFTAEDGAYTCLELGGLGKFKLTFTDITLTETEKPAVPEPPVPPEEPENPEHTHSFVNGICSCGVKNGFETYKTWTEGSLTPMTREDTENSMSVISTNASGDWWKVKVENNFATVAGKTYEATYTFSSNVAGDIKFGGDNMVCSTADVYNVTVGANTFKVTFTVSADNAYNCLELGGLGNFKLTFTGISLKEIVEEEPEHTHSFVNGKCECGESNGFAGVNVWTEGALTPVVREDDASSMTITSTNGAADWWKMKVENNFATVAGKTYEATYTFTSNVAGDIKFGGDNMTCATADVYHVAVGANTFKVTFTVSTDNAYNCLELGGLGNFKLTFTGISLKEVVAEHTHSFVNGKCECGAGNGFAGVNVWTEGSLTPVTREDTENSMIVSSTNAPNDWWKVKVEWPLAITEGKTYEATFSFSSTAAGTIKYHVGAAIFHDSQEYNVAVGSNTFKVRFTAGVDNYSCLELGGLGNVKLTFTGISLKEVEAPHTHSFVNGKCECGAGNGFAGVNVWTEGSLTPATREDTENSMIVSSTNAPGDWWKVKVEPGLGFVQGKTYDVTFRFTSNASGRIKYHVDGAAYEGTNEYDVVAGSNTFTVRLTAGEGGYNCLELGGLGAFKLTFTGISSKEIE